MSPAARIRTPTLALVVGGAAVLWLFGFQTSVGGPPTDPPAGFGYYLQFVIGWALLATPWLVAVRLLRRDRSGTAEKGRPGPDLPARLVAAAVLTLPEGRRPWGAAMTAELAEVQGPSGRWRFAAGCVQAALLPPSRERAPAWRRAAVVGGTALIVGSVVGGAFPALLVFVVTFIALIGALAVVAAARSGPIRRAASSRALTATAGLAGVAGCIAVTAYFLARYPSGALHLQPASAVLLAAILAGLAWLMLRPPRSLTTDRLAPRTAVGATVLIGAGLLVTSRLGLRQVAGMDAGIFGYVYLAPIVMIFAGSAWASALRRSPRAGVQTAVWTALLASPVTYAVAVSEAVRWYALDTSLILASDAVPLDAVGENLRNFTWALLLLPFWWLPFGIIGAYGPARVSALAGLLASPGGPATQSATSVRARRTRRPRRP